ncbi:MAG: YiiX/YebB-like N1pC/P60 family cysteine hydrolase [Candidatus Berkiella sp.]
MFRSLKESIINWITYEPPPSGFPLCDFERIRYEVRPSDVLLIEGRSRASMVIKQITQSSWSHSCIYIGRLHDIDDIQLRQELSEQFTGSPDEQLVIEGYLGKGTIVTPLKNYRHDHIRICRPRGLSRKDAQKVLAFAISQLGTEYNTRQIFDLARFLVPWSILPSRWRSSLFEHNVGESTKTVCSTMIAEAFSSVEFPILPLIKQHEETGIELIQRNPKLYTPRDFDYSPFFEIIKYPFIELSDSPHYRNLPWNRTGVVSSDGQSIDEIPIKPKKESQKTSELNPELDNAQTIQDSEETVLKTDADNDPATGIKNPFLKKDTKDTIEKSKTEKPSKSLLHRITPSIPIKASKAVNALKGK